MPHCVADDAIPYSLLLRKITSRCTANKCVLFSLYIPSFSEDFILLVQQTRLLQLEVENFPSTRITHLVCIMQTKNTQHSHCVSRARDSEKKRKSATNTQTVIIMTLNKDKYWFKQSQQNKYPKWYQLRFANKTLATR